MRPRHLYLAVPLALLIGTLALIARPEVSSGVVGAIVTRCNTEVDHAACYEREVPALYPKLSVPQVFEAVRSIREKDPQYQFCHVLAHKLGERVVAEDPLQWVDAIPLNPPDGLCSNGFIHGVIGGRFRAEVLDLATLEKLTPDFSRACEARANWQPSDLDRAICYHGMGHLFDFITNADLPHALRLCQETVPEDFKRVCIEGVFMQIYQPLEPDDFQLIEQMPLKPATSTVRQYCELYGDPAYVGACLRESWPFFQKEILDGLGVAAFCAGQPDTQQEELCFRSAFTILGRLSLGKTDRGAHACRLSPVAYQEMCYEVVAQTILEEDRIDAKKAVAFCSNLTTDFSHACMAHLLNTARFIFGPARDQYGAFCAALPSEFKSQCIAL